MEGRREKDRKKLSRIEKKKKKNEIRIHGCRGE